MFGIQAEAERMRSTRGANAAAGPADKSHARLW